MRSLLSLALGGFLMAHVLAGCYEIPPSVPSDYTGGPSESIGWPPPAVYARDPIHPRNRWFHRSFSSRDRRGQLSPVSGTEPLPVFKDPDNVDRAEMVSLLESIQRESPADPEWGPDSRGFWTELMFHSDVLVAALRLSSRQSKDSGERDRIPAHELLRLLVEQATVDLESDLLDAHRRPPMLDPPPLRDGAWKELDPPSAVGLRPSVEDPRWTRRMCRTSAGGETTEVLLLRLRVALLETGDPLLIPMASECWELRDGEGAEARPVRVWRFHRAAWVAGREPWALVPGTEPIEIHDPESAGARVLRGPARSLCGRCHAAWEPSGCTSPSSDPAPAIRKQKARLRDVIRRELGPLLPPPAAS